MSYLTVDKLAEIIGAKLPEDFNGNIKCGRVLTQSMYVKPGEVVISAGWYPHDRIIPESLEKGAAVVFCDKQAKERYPQPNVIPVDDPKECVTRFEKWRAQLCNAKRIAITGSVGKTTTTGLINSVIANSFNTLTHHTMSNSHGAILRNVQRLTPLHKYWVQEVGGVQPGYIESSARFLCPDIVVLTNIGESHLNLYGTKENILKDKGSLEKYAQPGGTVVISYDDDILRNAKFTHNVVSCSLHDDRADYHAEDIHTELDGVHFTAVCKEGRFDVHLNLYGDYNIYNALFAIAVGRLAGVDMKKICKLLETYQPDGMRQNFISVGGYTLFVDAFNAEPKTVLGSATTLAQIPMSKSGRRIFVTGHIDKLGADSAKMHRQLGHELSKLDLDLIVLFAGDSKYTYESLKEDGFKNALLMGSRDELDNWLHDNVTRDDVVFFKSGQFEAALVKSIDHVYGTSFQNEQQFNEGKLVEYNGYKLRLRQDNIAEVEGYNGSDTQLVLPAKYGDYVITRISPFAFTKHRDITSVVIPDTVVSIGQEAFYICPKLKYVKLPSQLKIIGKNAFNYCKALETVEIPYGTIHIDRHAFYDCFALKAISIPETVGFFGEDVFGSVSQLLNRSLTIFCAPGSFAAAYAKENRLSSANIADMPASPLSEPQPSCDDGLVGNFKKLAEEQPREAARVLNAIIDHLESVDNIDIVYSFSSRKLRAECTSDGAEQ